MWINERSEWVRVSYLIKLSLKSSKGTGIKLTRQFLSEKIKVKLNSNNINIEQGQLNYDWFTHHCVLTKPFEWLMQKTHILSLKRI